MNKSQKLSLSYRSQAGDAELPAEIFPCPEWEQTAHILIVDQGKVCSIPAKITRLDHDDGEVWC